MNFVIPMAGRGERFRKAGFKLPKMLIQAHGKTLLQWSVDSLPLELCTNLIFIGLKEHKEEFMLEDVIRDIYKDFNPVFVWLDDVTRGQAETVVKAKDFIDMNCDLVIFNIDTMFVSKTLGKKMQDEETGGILGAFHSNEPRFSYAKIGEDGYVLETAEKVVISEYALTGLYHFKKASDFFDIAEQRISQNNLTGGEFYIAPMYNDLIMKGLKLSVDMCSEHWILGTPDELQAFCERYKS